MIVDKEVALKVLEEVVAEQGADHIASVCQIYDIGVFNETNEKVPMCIVGYAIDKLVGHEMFQEVDTGTVNGPAWSVGISLTDDAHSVFSNAQKYQDGVYTNADLQPWGEALEYAKANA